MDPFGNYSNPPYGNFSDPSAQGYFSPQAQQFPLQGQAPPQFPPQQFPSQPYAAQGQYGQYPPPGQFPATQAPQQYQTTPSQTYDPQQQYNPVQFSPYNPSIAPEQFIGGDMAKPVQLQPVGRGGNKKALLIGINYIGSANALSGCIPDVHKMKQYLNSQGFMDGPNMLILTDDNPNQQLQPNKLNILNAFNWLLQGAKSGDSLFFHYSGHGSQVNDTNGDEQDGKDETICPVDFRSAGQIIDDTIHDFLVKPLPWGARLTSVMDCCHSGTGMDLPYIYGGTRDANFEIAQTKRDMQQKRDYLAGTSVGDVILFSGCQDNQTSADTTSRINGMSVSGGAMTTAFLKALQGTTGQVSYAQFLIAIRNELRSYQQVVQLSTGRPMDMNQPYYI